MKINAYLGLGIGFYNIKDYESFAHYIVKVLSEVDPSNRAHVLEFIGNIFYQNGNYITAGESYAEALGISLQLGKTRGFKLCLKLFDACHQLNEVERAAEYLHRGSEIAKEIANERMITEIHKNLVKLHGRIIANTVKQLDREERAEEIARKAEEYAERARTMGD